MTEQDPKGLTRRGFLECSMGVAVTVGVLPACGGSDDAPSTQSGANATGGSSTGGKASTATSSTGGSTSGKGGSTSSSGGTGGNATTSGTTTGGATTGGATTGGATANGGTTATGGSNNGGTPTGGSVSTGGKSTGGNSATGGSTATGGKSTGGNSATGGSTATGGKSTGGNTATGGTSTGGSVGTGGSGGSGTALVGIVRNASVATAVADAVAIAGGMPSLSGKTVLIKPNVVCFSPSPYTTNPAVVVALINMAKAKGAARIIVADRSDGGWVTSDAFSRIGMTTAVAQAGAELLDLGTGTFTVINPPGATNWTNGISYSNQVRTGIDYLVNVPCCKHHLMSNYTAAIKNWMGIIEQEGPGKNTGRSRAHTNLGQLLPELHLGVREHLVVMDATKICLTEGPFGPGEEASPQIIVASTDPVAVDVVAICLLKHYLKLSGRSNPDIDAYTPWTQPQIVRAMQIGIGITSKQAFGTNYIAQGVSEISTIMGYLNS